MLRTAMRTLAPEIWKLYKCVCTNYKIPINPEAYLKHTKVLTYDKTIDIVEIIANNP